MCQLCSSCQFTWQRHTHCQPHWNLTWVRCLEQLEVWLLISLTLHHSLTFQLCILRQMCFLDIKQDFLQSRAPPSFMCDGAISVKAAAAAVAEWAAAAAEQAAAVQFWHTILRNAQKVRPQIQHIIQQKVLWRTSIPQRKVRTDAGSLHDAATAITP